MTRRPTLFLAGFFALSACSGDFWRGCTATVVGKTIETTKEVSSGVAEGIEDGRKSGQSVDGATLATNMADLQGIGSISVFSIDAAAEGETSQVVLALENTSDAPLRVTGIAVTVLDKDGFVQKPTGAPTREITVPPRAKERATFDFALKSDAIGTVRLWDEDLVLP
jgi:hypothetical protein